MVDIDFTSGSKERLCSDVFNFIKKKGKLAFRDNFRGISPGACQSVEQLATDIIKDKVRVKSPAILEAYFQQNYIMNGFLSSIDDIKWHPEIEPPGTKKCFVDFTMFHDTKEVESEFRDFVKKVGRHELGKDYEISKPVEDGIRRLFDSHLYGKKSGGYIIEKPSDLKQYFSQGHIIKGFQQYEAQVKWMRGGRSDRSQELHSLDSEFLLDFTQSNLRVLKLQMDAFLLKAGREFHSRNYSISKTIMKQVDRLLNIRFYGFTQEHNITKPEDLEIFFYQKFVQAAFRQQQHKIKWAKPLVSPPKHVYRRYFDVPLRRPPLRRVPQFKNPMVKDSWLEKPLDRKLIQQEELFWQAVNLRAAIKSPVELMPTVYAQKEGDGCGTVWWSAKFSATVTSTAYRTSTVTLPTWINNMWKNIDFTGNKMGHETFLNQPSHTKFGTDNFVEAPFTVYCLIVYVLDFARWHLFNCSCKGRGDCGRGPCPFQVYVGKAQFGLIDRWITKRYAHTRVTKRIVNYMFELRDKGEPYQRYDPGPDSDAQLPQCMLGLSKENYDPAALFVLRSCEDKAHMEEMERKIIKALKATDMSKGLNAKSD